MPVGVSIVIGKTTISLRARKLSSEIVWGHVESLSILEIWEFCDGEK